MLKRTSAGLAAGLLFTAMSAQAAVVNGVFTVENVSFVDLYSTTLDNGNNPVLPNSTCTGLAGDALQECQFFEGVPSANRAITVTDDGYNLGEQLGTLDVDYDNVTGEIVQVNAMNVPLQDLTVNICSPGFGCDPATNAGATVAVVENGNGIPAANANEQARFIAGLPGSNATADADQAPAIGQASIFQHRDLLVLDAPTFSTFSDIVDSCTGAACILIGLLSLNSDGYRIDGTVNPLGGDTLRLRAQTQGNNSIWTLDMTTAVVPVPAAVWLFGSALGLLGWMRRRAA